MLTLIGALAVFYLATGLVIARHAWRVFPVPARAAATSFVLALLFGCGFVASFGAAVPVPALVLLGFTGWEHFYPPQLQESPVDVWLWQPFLWQWLAIHAVFIVTGYVRGSARWSEQLDAEALHQQGEAPEAGKGEHHAGAQRQPEAQARQ